MNGTSLSFRTLIFKCSSPALWMWRLAGLHLVVSHARAFCFSIPVSSVIATNDRVAFPDEPPPHELPILESTRSLVGGTVVKDRVLHS